MPPDIEPTLDQWRELFRLAQQVQQLEPWKWMSEDDLFGVEDPQTGEWGFVSVLGEAGEYFAINVSRGSEGLYDYLDFLSMRIVNPLQLSQIPLLHVSFSRKSDMEPEDLKLIKKLKLKITGKVGWISFQQHQYGFLPAQLEAQDVSLMQCALEQLLLIAQRTKEDKTLLYPELIDDENASFDEDVFDEDDLEDTPVKTLFRIPRREGDQIEWEDAIRAVPFPEPPKLNIRLDLQNLEAVKKLPKYRTPIEMEVILLPTPMEEDSPRPYFPFMLIAIDGKKEQILFSEMMRPLPSVEAMYEGMPIKILSGFMMMGKIPTHIHIKSSLTELLLKPISSALKIKLVMHDELPAVDAAASGLMQYLFSDVMELMDDEDDDFLLFDNKS